MWSEALADSCGMEPTRSARAREHEAPPAHQSCFGLSELPRCPMRIVQLHRNLFRELTAIYMVRQEAANYLRLARVFLIIGILPGKRT